MRTGWPQIGMSDHVFYWLLGVLASLMVSRLRKRGLPVDTEPHWVRLGGKYQICHGAIARINQYRICTECGSIHEEN